MIKKLISTAALLIAMDAGAYKFTHITTENSDLSYDGISKITQDSRGFIWIGTYKGLNRYDGTAFKAWYKDDLGLISDFIHSIEEDLDGNLWIGTDNGVTKYDYLTDTFEPLAKVSDKGTVIKNKVTLISVDGPVVWMFVNDQGVFRYDTASEELRNIPYDEIGISGLRKMLKNPDGSFWVSRYHSNLYLADKDFRKISPVELTDAPDYFADDEIEGLFPAQGSKLYVASIKNGVSEVDPARKTVRNLFRLPRESMLRDAFMETGGGIVALHDARNMEIRHGDRSGRSLQQKQLRHIFHFE